MNRLLLTGASGGMARSIRPLLGQLAKTVVLTSRKEITDLASHEEWYGADLTDTEALQKIVNGCDAIVHLGGYSVEGQFAPILEANIQGLYNLYEAARLAGMPRILFASTNHVIGYYPQTQRLKGDVLHRPDSLYGVSKSFGESLARFYFEKYGQETAIVRIGSCLEKPENYRQLATWLSHHDFCQLVDKIFTAPWLGCPIIYGVSNNDRSWWDNADVSYLGWAPKDNSEIFAKEIAAADPKPNSNAPVNRYQGGNMIELPNFTEISND